MSLRSRDGSSSSTSLCTTRHTHPAALTLVDELYWKSGFKGTLTASLVVVLYVADVVSLLGQITASIGGDSVFHAVRTGINTCECEPTVAAGDNRIGAVIAVACAVVTTVVTWMVAGNARVSRNMLHLCCTIIRYLFRFVQHRQPVRSQVQRVAVMENYHLAFLLSARLTEKCCQFSVLGPMLREHPSSTEYNNEAIKPHQDSVA